MNMPMDSHPAIAFRILACGIKLPGGLNQRFNQSWIMHQPLLIQRLVVQKLLVQKLLVQRLPAQRLPVQRFFLQSRLILGLQIRTLQMKTFAPIQSLQLNPRVGRWIALVGTVVLTGGQASIAQVRMAGSCPLVVPQRDSELQPRRITPGEVAAKNAGGCLSPSDAIYGPDGCPKKLCGPNAGVIPLTGS